jgi:large subunit ribosomal protein L7/L12
VVIKEIRAITGLGLKEAKEFTEAAGPSKVVKSDLTKDEANAIKTRLEAAGGVVSIQ